jgi:hypothetical protein
LHPYLFTFLGYRLTLDDSNGRRKGGRLLALVAVMVLVLNSWAMGQESLPPATAPVNRLSDDWLIYASSQNQLVPYLKDYHPARNALYQWVHLRPGYPFLITFKAKKDLTLFVDNQLIFTADSPAIYTLDLMERLQQVARPKKGPALLGVWHPAEQPNFTSFANVQTGPDAAMVSPAFARQVNLAREDRGQNAFILFLLLIGLLYGGLKASFPADFNSLFRVSSFLRTSTLEEGFLARPIGSWSVVFFIMAFSLSFSLLIVAIRTDVQQIYLFNRLYTFSEADIFSRIFFYAFLTFAFFILKYLFLQLMGFIFDLSSLVRTQYREFVRSTLFMGLFLPAIMLLYLRLNPSMPGAVLLVSNMAVSVLLVITALRVFRTLNKKTPLLNLHIFSYICATEVIPLMVILKLVVFNYQ